MTYERKFQEVVKSQGMYKNGYFGLYLMDEQIDFLVEYVHELRAQAERAKELESEFQGLRSENLRLSSEVEGLLDRNNVLRSDLTANRNLYDLSAKGSKRYREALEFYAAEDIYEWETYYNPQQQMDCMVIDDGGHRARRVLEAEK